MIQAESDPQKRDEYLQRLMELPNQASLQKNATISGNTAHLNAFLFALI